MSPLFLLQVLLACAIFTGDYCNAADNSNRRFIQGTQPEAARLYREARRADAGPWTKGFSEEHFIFLGKLTAADGSVFKVAFLKTIWGQSNRATERLLVFSRTGHYLGRYSGFSATEAPTILPPATLHFPLPAMYGNEVNFDAGPPLRLWVDGDNLEYEPANSALVSPSLGKPRLSTPLQR